MNLLSIKFILSYFKKFSILKLLLLAGIIIYIILYSINQNILYFTNNKSYKIPRIIHQIYIQGESELQDFIKDVIEENKRNNPDYIFKIYSYDDIKKYIYNNTNDKIIKCFEKLNPECYTCLSDFFRYIIVYYEGGIYLDVKTGINKPLNRWVTNDKLHINLSPLDSSSYNNELLDKYYDSEHKPKGDARQIIQNIIMYPKNHPLLKKVIDDMCYNITNNTNSNNILFMTGPVMYTKAIAPQLKYYNYKLYENGIYDDYMKFDGTNGKYYEYMKGNKLHWSQKKDRVTI